MMPVTDQPPQILRDAERLDAERLRQEQEDYLDEALKETFPASDPIAPGRPHPPKSA